MNNEKINECLSILYEIEDFLDYNEPIISQCIDFLQDMESDNNE